MRRRTWLLSGLMALGVLLGASLDDLFTPAVAQSGSESDDRQTALANLAGEVAYLERQGNILKSVVRLASPSIVHIEARKMTGGARPRMIEEAGSGIIIAEGGAHYVLTNRHVIRDAARERITIRLHDSREVVPTRVWSDPETDIAVLAIAAPRVIPAQIGDSSGVDIGEFVLAVGSPFGLSRSVTFGIISAKGRRDLELGGDEIRYQDFLQTDAAINPGNSGGPLLNLRCEVIGMNTAIASSSGGSEGIGFTIPINMAMVIARQLIEHGYVARAFLGVNLDSEFSASMAEQMGLPRLMGTRVTAITPESPAAAADLQVGDIILSYDGTPVEDDVHLVNLVSLTRINKEVRLVVFRDGQEREVRVSVGDRAAFNDRQPARPVQHP
ncbi:MAG: trypsin-like peptidase domain-containing protein [Pirellulales bacterium]|nr:trypsin-like peptidase domain-containing protein [Pirellulales bacterium]